MNHVRAAAPLAAAAALIVADLRRVNELGRFGAYR